MEENFREMMLLDYFAGQALIGLLARSDGKNENKASQAYDIAEEMIKEKKKRIKPMEY